MDERLTGTFWDVGFAGPSFVIESLRFDAAGNGQFCDNLLKTGSPKSIPNAIAQVCGALSGYFDPHGGLFLSQTAPCPRLGRPNEREVLVEDIFYGNVREQWRIRLDGDSLIWKVAQEWDRDTELADAFFPGLFFAAREEWGRATVFQLWDDGTPHDDFYGVSSLVAAAGPSLVSRRVQTAPKTETTVKLLSRARPNSDLRVAADRYIKKGELLNYMSLLAHAPACEPRETIRMRPGQRAEMTLVLQPRQSMTGVSLEIEVSGPLREVCRVNRRFHDTHTNCAIMADTVNWRFGNEPSGYVALFCQFMYSEIVRFGVKTNPSGPNCTDPHAVLAREVRQMADNLVASGSLGSGYQADTALDSLPSFLLALRDLLVLEGNRETGEALFGAARLATAQIRERLLQGGQMIAAGGERGNDYWDWIDRDGRITSINVLTYMSLGAMAEVAEWLGHESEATEARVLADGIAKVFNAEFWNEEAGFYADWIDGRGAAHFFGYVGPQLQAVVNGMVPADRARRLLESIDRRRRELGPEWAKCFALQTNLFDAEEYSSMRRAYQSDVTRFGQTMNGGCLLSWSYYWIGALVAVGRAQDAIDVWKRIVSRFGQTSLIEGCNYWDFSGRPSRTTFAANEIISYEPFLADQGLVSAALPRWLLGVDPRLNGLKINPVLPAVCYPVRMHLQHLGRLLRIEMLSPHESRIAEAGESKS